MASITITVTGTSGFEITRSFVTDDANVPAIVEAYIADIAIASARDADGNELPRDADWAVAQWMREAIGSAAAKAESRRRMLAAEAAAAAVPAIVVSEVGQIS